MSGPEYPALAPCPKCGASSPFRPRPDTPHYGEIRCEEHGHAWVKKPDADKRTRRKVGASLIDCLHETHQDFCWFCFRRKELLASLLPPTRLEVHHIVPVRDGGSDEPHNLILLCSECHAEAHPRRESFNRYMALVDGGVAE